MDWFIGISVFIALICILLYLKESAKLNKSIREYKELEKKE